MSKFQKATPSAKQLETLKDTKKTLEDRKERSLETLKTTTNPGVKEAMKMNLDGVAHGLPKVNAQIKKVSAQVPTKAPQGVKLGAQRLANPNFGAKPTTSGPKTGGPVIGKKK